MLPRPGRAGAAGGGGAGGPAPPAPAEQARPAGGHMCPPVQHRGPYEAYSRDPGVVSDSPVSSSVLSPDRIWGQPP